MRSLLTAKGIRISLPKTTTPNKQTLHAFGFTYNPGEGTLRIFRWVCAAGFPDLLISEKNYIYIRLNLRSKVSEERLFLKIIFKDVDSEIVILFKKVIVSPSIVL